MSHAAKAHNAKAEFSTCGDRKRGSSLERAASKSLN